MKKMLVTAFEPFGGDAINPTMEIVKALPDKICGVPVVTMVLPVEYGRAAHLAIQKIEETGADIVVSLGLAGGRSAVTPERIAINVMDARIPDGAGFAPMDQKIDANGAAGYFTRLPIRKMTEACVSAGIPAQISNTAGTYVCNDLMYRLLSYRENVRPSLTCGFIHVPYCDQMPKENAPQLSLAAEIKAILCMCEVIVKEQQQSEE